MPVWSRERGNAYLNPDFFNMGFPKGPAAMISKKPSTISCHKMEGVEPWMETVFLVFSFLLGQHEGQSPTPSESAKLYANRNRSSSQVIIISLVVLVMGVSDTILITPHQGIYIIIGILDSQWSSGESRHWLAWAREGREGGGGGLQQYHRHCHHHRISFSQPKLPKGPGQS